MHGGRHGAAGALVLVLPVVKRQHLSPRSCMSSRLGSGQDSIAAARTSAVVQRQDAWQKTGCLLDVILASLVRPAGHRVCGRAAARAVVVRAQSSAALSDAAALAHLRTSTAAPAPVFGDANYVPALHFRLYLLLDVS